MRTKSAIFREAKQPISVEETELQDPQAGEVLVRVAATDACHSDYHAVDGRNEAAMTPLVMGHEGAGIVEGVGPSVIDFAEGDHVVFAIRPMCGKCKYCSTSRPNLCNGIGNKPGHMRDGTTRFKSPDGATLYHGLATFSQHTVVPEWSLVKVADDVPIERLASLGCAVVTGVGAVVNTARVTEGATVAVWGCGGVGLNVIQGAVIAGASRIIAVDIDPKKFAFATDFGATDTINPSKENLDEVVSEVTGGKGVDITVEAGGYPETLEGALRLVKNLGKTVIFGIQGGVAGQRMPLDTSLFLRKAPTSGDPITHIENMIALKERGWWDPGEMVTHTMPFDDVQKAYDMYENYEDNMVKVVLTM